MNNKYTTNNYKQTQRLGEKLARDLSSPRKRGSGSGAIILALHGNLGGGKTTFLQGFAKGLGVKEKILSPTFVMMKHFKFKISNLKFTDFYHIDCYRMNNAKDIIELGFNDIIKNPCNIVAIEWPEKIKKFLPKNLIKIDFKFIDEKTREIKFKM